MAEWHACIFKKAFSLFSISSPPNFCTFQLCLLSFFGFILSPLLSVRYGFASPLLIGKASKDNHRFIEVESESI
jgi:hypothetical protein